MPEEHYCLECGDECDCGNEPDDCSICSLCHDAIDDTDQPDEPEE